MGLLDRYLGKEILLPFGASLLFLTQILLATTILGQAEVLFGSGVALGEVGLVIAALLPSFLGYVIPIAFLLGAVIGVGRLAEDREVVALGAAGISPARLLRVPFLLGVAVAAIAVWLALYVEPLGLRSAHLRMNDIVKRNVMSDVRGGTFYDQIPGYTLYAQTAEGGRWGNVLIHDRTNEAAPVLALARRGQLEPVGDGQDMRLVLREGELHREQPDADEYAVAAFDRAQVRVALGTALSDKSGMVRESRELTLADYRGRIADARAKGDLAGARRWEGTLHRKISGALVVIPFALLAVPLGAFRRGGRAFGIGASFLVVVIHYVLLRGGEVLVQRGTLPPVLGLELANVILAAAGLGLTGWLARTGPGAVR